MRRLMIALALLGALAVATAASSLGGGRSVQTVTLNGTVGPGYTITLKRAGKKVTTLKAGTYRFVVADRSTFHNFEIEKESGGEFERDITDVSETGTKTVTLRLTKGSWKYYCKPHEAQMHGTFRVT
jgi:plastocyanin